MTLNTDMGTVKKGLVLFGEQKQLPAVRPGAALFVELRQNARLDVEQKQGEIFDGRSYSFKCSMSGRKVME